VLLAAAQIPRVNQRYRWIYSENFRVLGLMPHPENLIDPLVAGLMGAGLFESVAGFTRAA